jgi:hypothetical protein
MANEQFNHAIKNAKTMREIFTAVNNYYDTDKQLGAISGTLVKANIEGFIQKLSLKPRK